eukprot:scaffold2610_cov301-Prasinococcus_capsulatus_cf.AAC.5
MLSRPPLVETIARSPVLQDVLLLADLRPAPKGTPVARLLAEEPPGTIPRPPWRPHCLLIGADGRKRIRTSRRRLVPSSVASRAFSATQPPSSAALVRLLAGDSGPGGTR